MTIDTFAQDLLTGLREGQEINWDYVPNMVQDGRIRREDAMSSLKQLLARVIPEYIRMRREGDMDYWGLRLAEAYAVREYIDTGLTVKFRGIPLRGS